MSELAKREENGAKGESLTQSILLSRFWVMKRSADVDGADFLVQHPSDTLDELRERAHEIDTMGIIQSKYFENSNRVRVQRSYVLQDGVPRKNFFCMLHSHDEDEEPVHYFFSAEDIVKDFKLSDCQEYYWFALAAERQYKDYKNKEQKFINEKIRTGMFQAEAEATRKFMKKKLTVYASPTMHFQEQPDFEYMLDVFNNVRVVIACDMAAASRRLLEPRRDLFQYNGDFCWGYSGTGSQFLAVSMLAHHLDGASPSDAAVRKLMKHLQCLEDKSSHVIKSEILQECVNTPISASARLEDLEDDFAHFLIDPNTGIFEVVSLFGNQLKIKCRDGIESVLNVKGRSNLKVILDAVTNFTKGIESSSEPTKKMLATMLYVRRDPETRRVLEILHVCMARLVD